MDADPVCDTYLARIAVRRDNWTAFHARLDGAQTISVIALIPMLEGAELVYLGDDGATSFEDAWQFFGPELPDTLAGVILEAPLAVCDLPALADVSTRLV